MKVLVLMHALSVMVVSMTSAKFTTKYLSVCFFFIGAQSFSYARFGRGTGPSLIDRLGCTGREKALLNCSHTEIGGFSSSYCRYNDDVGVRCQGNGVFCTAYACMYVCMYICMYV